MTIYDEIRSRWGNAETFVRRMKATMHDYEISQVRLAERLGTSRGVVGRWCRSVDHTGSDGRLPDLENRIRISEALEEIVSEIESQ